MASSSRVFRPSRTRWAVILSIAIVFTLAGAVLFPREEVLRWFIVLFFGLMVFISALQFVPGANYLELRRDGFTFSSLFRKKSFFWSDVEQFGTYRMANSGSEYVGFNLSQNYRKNLTFGEKISITMVGWEAGLPDTYGMKAQKLAELMEEWRARNIKK